MPTTAYRSGTVSVTPGSPVVAGVGTLFMSSMVRPGDVFECQGLTASIQSVDNNAQITLVRPWPGVLPVSGASYEVRFTSDAIRVMAAARTVQQILESGNLPALANLQANSDQMAYFIGPQTMATTPLTALARELMSAPTTQAMRTLLGLSAFASAGLRILGSFSNMGQLPTTANVIGDAYLVNGTVQIYNGTGWTNAGPIVGPAGQDGVQIYQTRAAAINGVPNLATSVTNILVRNGTTLEVRQRNQNLSTTDPLFATGDGWGVTFRMNMNDAFIPVTSIGGTANVITATFGPALTNTAGTRISFIPLLANTGNATLNGVQLRDMNGVALTAGALIPGRVYQFERMASANAWQMVGEPFGRADAQSILSTSLGSVQQAIALLQASVSALEGQAEAGFDATTGEEGFSLFTDVNDRTWMLWRTDNADPEENGVDFYPSRQLAERMAPFLNLSGGGGGGTGGLLSTTALHAIGVNGQSLSVGGPFAPSGGQVAAVTRAELLAAAQEGAALFVEGTVRADNVAITAMDMPRSAAYNESVLATGLGPASPSTQVVSAAWPLAAAMNFYRKELGLEQVPVTAQCHGISGDLIENIDDDPATGSGSLTIWNNMRFWHSQAKRAADLTGRKLYVPYHYWVHGTSAKSYAPLVYYDQLWNFKDDMQANLRSQGIDGPAHMLMSQPGGNTNTQSTNDPWEVVDEILAFCEAGGGVLTTPEYAYQIWDNNVHPDAYDTVQFAEVAARAAAEVQAGNRWTIGRPKPTIIGTTLVLTFDTLRPGEYLVGHDPARYGGQGIDNYLGFQATNTTFTGVQIRGNQVVFTCNAPPTGIRYAYQKQDVRAFANNRWNAHRGLLRTSDRWLSKLLADTWLYRWVPSFKMAF